MSSLPTSDGFHHPALPSGQSPEVGEPGSPARSVSASVCPPKPCDPDSLKPKAQKTLKAWAEFQTASEENAHPSLQHLSGGASAADSALGSRGPALLSQDSSQEAIVADNREASPTERSTQGLACHRHVKETRLSVTATRIETPQRLLGEMGWHPDSQSPSPGDSLQQHEEPGSEQHEAVPCCVLPGQKQPGSPQGLGAPGEQQQNPPKSVNLEATVNGDRLPQNVALPAAEKSGLRPGCCGCSSSETLMDVDVDVVEVEVEQSLAAVLGPAGAQKASIRSVGAPDLAAESPLMEVEPAKCNSAPAVPSNSIPTQDLQPPKSDAEMPGANQESGDCSPSLSLGGSSQPSTESTEEACSSVTAALKELHQLLVTSSKPALDGPSDDALRLPEPAAEGHTGVKNPCGRWTPSEHRTAALSEQCPRGSVHQALSVSVKVEESADPSLGTGIGRAESVRFQGPGDGPSTDQDGVPASRESVRESGSVTLASTKVSHQLHRSLGVEILVGEEDARSQATEQTQSSSSSFLLGPGAENPVSRENTRPEAAGPRHELEPPTSHPPPSPPGLPPLVFPAADVDRILRAGFTPQEALGALGRVGGNADLALLVLLAKNIVVPT